MNEMKFKKIVAFEISQCRHNSGIIVETHQLKGVRITLESTVEQKPKGHYPTFHSLMGVEKHCYLIENI